MLLKIRQIADFQFGKGAGKALFSDEVEAIFSKTTGRIRHVCLNGKIIATLRPKNGMFSLTVEGAKRIIRNFKNLRNLVKVRDAAASSVACGKSVFAKHVLDADEEIRPKEEVIVLDRQGNLLAVGRAVLTGREMKAFKTGVAVRVRKGVKEET